MNNAVKVVGTGDSSWGAKGVSIRIESLPYESVTFDKLLFRTGTDREAEFTCDEESVRKFGLAKAKDKQDKSTDWIGSCEPKRKRARPFPMPNPRGLNPNEDPSDYSVLAAMLEEMLDDEEFATLEAAKTSMATEGETDGLPGDQVGSSGDESEGGQLGNPIG
jgi:hypothetical protein